ncbi:Carbamoyltransferase [Magnetospirillum sp. LM-5]|uniref:carbamoyltransferase family protein n=1 Tax=Magnetospirillum sp. LM-5 TaxID=2681466 RepID=UPI001380331B|nr:carbamoyltransferase C-terminal domain-containing protein [Magnetospirillum sp. LM-5]CAA7618737.1 Carbamoyltransferase [Magnetospirillum sp. LM-5]
MILGVHFGSHDTSAAIVHDGEVLAMMEQERFDHRKHSTDFPHDAIRWCLDQAGITRDDLTCVAYANDVDVTNHFKRQFLAQAYPGAMQPSFHTQSGVEEVLRREIGNVALFRTDHHLAHAASTFLTSPFSESAIFTVDGMGNWVTTTLGVGRGDRIETLVQVPHPHSVGLFYGAVTQFLGFHAACDEGKTMGLAPYGKPTFADAFRQICRVHGGQLQLDLRYFTFHTQPLMDESGSPRLWYSGAFVERFGLPRTAEAALTERDADIACSAQVVLEECCYDLLRHLHGLTGCDNVCVAGGVGLNCSMNGKIRANTPFRDVFVMPAANDAGLSIGAALLASRNVQPGFRRRPMTQAYLGSEHQIDEIEAALKEVPPDIDVERPDDLVAAVATLLADYAIVGWYQGRMEFGPRALGHRSILANPTRADTKDIVNGRVKFREMFRPFAPVVPLEDVATYFAPAHETPFMLQVVSVLPDKREVIPSVTHVDGSARVQTVTPEQNADLYRLLKEMQGRNGVPVLLNTSFNVRGDTIVRTPQDAVRCFLGTGMNAVALGPYLLRKPGKADGK